MEPALHDRLPFAPWTDPVTRKLPGTRPADPDLWASVDEAYGAQMAQRDHLVTQARDKVIALLPEGRAAADELLSVGLAQAARHPGFARRGDRLTRPDGVTIRIRADDPMATLGRIFQQDLCILEAGPAAHVLTGAVLCFPSGWTLTEKIGLGLDRLHRPVPSYDSAIAARVQRMFDGLKPDRPIWRVNAHRAFTADLFTPRREADPRPAHTGTAPYLRSERQVLFRLPLTGAVVFSILTILVRREDLTPEQAETLAEFQLKEV